MQQMKSIAGMYIKSLLYNHNEQSKKESHYNLTYGEIISFTKRVAKVVLPINDMILPMQVCESTS